MQVMLLHSLKRHKCAVQDAISGPFAAALENKIRPRPVLAIRSFGFLKGTGDHMVMNSIASE
jgi:hypothetical protein